MDSNFEWLHRSYGKNHMKLLHLRRDGPVHTIKEYEVHTALTLSSDKDYISGDNSDIIATDSQKNTVYILAKRHGVKSPEDFALLLTSHFLTKYSHVISVKVEVKEYPWRRLVTEGKAHNHAFLFSPEVIHTCSVTHDRGGAPVVWTGIEGMRVLKTTLSSFTNFVDDEFCSLTDVEDRIFSTDISSFWEYNDTTNIDFGRIWIKMQKIIHDNFVGPPKYGVHSPSVQNTVYSMAEEALKKIPQITQLKIIVPNRLYSEFDLTKFPGVSPFGDGQIFLCLDKPTGSLTATLARKKLKAKF